MTANTVTKPVDTESAIRRCQNTISALRKQLTSNNVMRSQESEQQIYDKIEELKREIEGYRKKTRVIKPVVNAPIIAERAESRKRHKNHISIL